MVANGHSAEENHVSSTSGSRSSAADPHVAQAAGASSATVSCPSGQYHTGIWWPHQSCRDTHHGRMFSIQPK